MIHQAVLKELRFEKEIQQILKYSMLNIFKNNRLILIKFFTHIAYMKYKMVYKFHADPSSHAQ